MSPTGHRRNPATLWRRVSDDIVVVLAPELGEPTTLTGDAARFWLDLGEPADDDGDTYDRSEGEPSSLDMTLVALVLSGAIDELDER